MFLLQIDGETFKKHSHKTLVHLVLEKKRTHLYTKSSASYSPDPFILFLLRNETYPAAAAALPREIHHTKTDESISTCRYRTTNDEWTTWSDLDLVLGFLFCSVAKAETERRARIKTPKGWLEKQTGNGKTNTGPRWTAKKTQFLPAFVAGLQDLLLPSETPPKPLR